MLPDPCLESLKRSVLVNADSSFTAPHEARRLASLINSRVSHQLAEVALLRFFGFAPARFPPSLYTKDVLARFCGYNDYAMFCEKRTA